MKPSATSKPRFSPEQVAAALAAAPDVAAPDTDCPATRPEDWDNAILSNSLPELREKISARRRGPNKRPTKEAVTVRYSPDVLAFFRATGAGWQTRMDEAMREWIKTHSPV